ncbi:MAG: hypothetical protein J7513_11450 [Solirubrobacteraceae bacterium]|nr:hypothetical protein [Solirubrobacteraceae bacterium]
MRTLSSVCRWRVPTFCKLKCSALRAVFQAVASYALSTATPVDVGRRRLTTDLEQRGFVLHRRIVRADLPIVDHVVVASSGVWVVAREHVHCARVSVRRRHLTGDPVLKIGGRDRTALLAPFDDQLTALRATLFDFLDAPIQAALVLPGAEFPLLRTLTAGDHLVLRPAQLLTHLEARGPLKRSRAREIAEALDRRLA